MNLHECMVYHQSTVKIHPDYLSIMCIFHGSAFPDGNVYPVSGSRPYKT